MSKGHLLVWDILRDARFRVLFLAESINQLGSSLSLVATAWYLSTAVSAASAGWALGAAALGSMAGAAVLGPRLDRWDNGRVLRAVYGADVAIAAALAAGVDRGATAVTLGALMAAAGVGQSLTPILLSAAIPSLFGVDATLRAQSVLNLTWQIAGLAGPAAAGALLTQIGPVPLLWLNAASFIPPLLLMRSVHLRRPGQGVDRIELTGAIRHLAQTPILWGALVGVASVNMMFQASLVVVPRAFGHPGQFGVYEALVVMAEIIGSLSLARWMTSADRLVRRRWVLVGCVGPPVGLALTSAIPTWPVAAAGAAVNGLTIASVSTIWPALFAAEVPEHLRGRMSSLRFLIGGSLGPLGPLLAGSLMSRTSTAGAGLLVALSSVTVTTVGYVASRATGNVGPHNVG